MKLLIIPTGLLSEFKDWVDEDALSAAFDRLCDADLSNNKFCFYTAAASVYSCKIEGEGIDLDSYVKYKRFGVELQPDYIRKVDNLYEAYAYAKRVSLDFATFLEAYKLFIPAPIFQSQNVYVTTVDGRIESVAASPCEVNTAMEALYADITTLQEADLSIAEVFYFASMIHLVFVKIHPWTDGNGRSARLLEKWFLAVRMGEKAWFVQSEKFYYEHHQAYYDNIRALGLEYEALDYGKAMGFVRMLVGAVL